MHHIDIDHNVTQTVFRIFALQCFGTRVICTVYIRIYFLLTVRRGNIWYYLNTENANTECCIGTLTQLMRMF